MAAVGTTSRWAFPPVDTADEHGLLGVGADLEPATLVHAYRSGIFPMPVGRRMGWWSPDPRGILPLERLVVSRSLRRSVRRYEVRIDTSFVEVLRGCADPRRPNGWINQAVERAYLHLHDLGIAHSVEAWDAHTGELAGGLYGVAIGGLFAGESMFHRTVDASKVALVRSSTRCAPAVGSCSTCSGPPIISSASAPSRSPGSATSSWRPPPSASPR